MESASWFEVLGKAMLSDPEAADCLIALEKAGKRSETSRTRFPIASQIE
jgi:hypothetical protein